MRILQICSARSFGGGERHVADLSNALARRGHDVFAALRSGSPLTDELSAVPSENIGVFPFNNSFDVLTARKLASFAQNNSIELMNAHIARDFTITALAARFALIPFVITRHVLFPMHRMHRLLLRRAAFAIAQSNAVADNLRKERVFPDEKIATIRLGLDIDRFPETFASRDNCGYRVGSIGNLDHVKAFDVLIRAAPIVAREIPDVRFEIVGHEGSSDELTKLKQLITDLQLQNIVELAGWVPDVREKLSAFDVFVSASRSESFGLAIAEAMLAGVPVIASETAGASEIFDDPSLGVLVPIDSPDKLAVAIIEMLNNAEKRRRLSAAGRPHIKSNFSLHRMVDETEALYQRAISST